MARMTEPTTEDLARQMDALKGDLAKITETLSELGKAQGRALADDVRARAERARAEGERQAEYLQHRAEEMVDEAADMIRRQPAMALGLAAGVGFLVGLMTSRK
ncbi:YqjD family protein [Plastorhodobacter daqingensis]|uniref:YqjD family protein n=1 Tax=Plastorhodobacter daqingensis TaxID=1387281 RepID=A0ABW2UPZ0_9RHOB